MLKKAGIIVAAVATGVLAVSSLAFADTSTGNLKNDCAFGNAGGAPALGATGATAWSAACRRRHQRRPPTSRADQHR